MSSDDKSIYANKSVNAEHEAVSGWFLGPRAENFNILKEKINFAIEQQQTARQNYYKDDGDFITTKIKDSEAYKKSTCRLNDQLTKLSNVLNEHSVPFWSARYMAHMTADTTLPGILGYVTTMLFNPNNVAIEASPITTVLEIWAGQQLCKMLGFNVPPAPEIPGITDFNVGALPNNDPVSWGHITCDARNLKFYPLSLRKAIDVNAPLGFIAETFKVHTCVGKEKLFKDLTVWEMLNLKVTTILDIPERLYKEYAISSAFLQKVMEKYTIQTVGKDALEKEFGIDKPIQYFVTQTRHYSWPKGGAVAGIGSGNIVGVPVDVDARLDVGELRKLLEKCWESQQAVYAVVAILGSTEEGAVDPLGEILDLRDEFQARGMSFVVHADAAWGGYFASMLWDRPKEGFAGPPRDDLVLGQKLRESTKQQLERIKDVDSVTIDPHKTGFIPYPAGGLCYRDNRMRYLVTWTSPYISRDGNSDLSIGIYGVEGSKPGASAVATWLSNRVIGLDKEGYGALLGETLFTSSRIYAHWAAMSTDKTSFIVVPLNMLPTEKLPDTPEKQKEIEKQKKFIREHILDKKNETLVKDEAAMKLLQELGSDLMINIFACNFRLSNGELNKDVEEANYLNKSIVERLSVASPDKNPADVPLFLTSTEFSQDQYGVCAANLKKRLKLEGDVDLFVFRNVVMSPFPTQGNFIKDLAGIFKNVVEEEVVKCRERNEIRPAIHSFIIQGINKLYLVHQPMFYKANDREQLIVSAEIESKYVVEYVKARTNEPFYLATKKEEILEDILKTGSSFTAVIKNADGTIFLDDVKVSKIQIVKRRRLDSKFRDSNYPMYDMPFYLYGTPKHAHIDHMLLLAPNIQLSADEVTLKLDNQLSDGDLEKGAIVQLNGVYERSMQPFLPMSDLVSEPNFFFRPGKEFNVSIYRDPNGAVAEGPGLANVKPHDRIATGTMTLTGNVYIDSEKLNADPFAKKAKFPQWDKKLKAVFGKD
ncbi:hypothetical protein RUND412_009012 [Rhizina undulata]